MFEDISDHSCVQQATRRILQFSKVSLYITICKIDTPQLNRISRLPVEI